MKQFLYTTTLTLCLFIVTAVFAQKTNTTQNQNQNIKAAHEYLLKMKANPETGRIEPADVLKARHEADKLAENSNQKSGTVNWEFMGPDNIGGRTRAILIDKDNPQKLMAGSVSGGLFTSNDGGLNWTDHPENTEFAGLSIGVITQGSDGTIYVGTGESPDGSVYGLGSAGYTGLPGKGVYKSTDGGISFQLLPETVPTYAEGVFYDLDWAFIKSIEVSPVNPNWVYVATSYGVQMSQDAGNTWSKANGIAANSSAYSIAIAGDGKTHILADSTYYQAEDGLNFTSKLVVELEYPLSIRNKVMAMSPSNNDYLYIVTLRHFACLSKVWQSKDGGETWNRMDYGEGGTFYPLGCEGWFSLSLAVNPSNPSQFFLGGTELWSWEEEVGWNQLVGTISNPIEPYISVIEFDLQNPNTVYLGAATGLSKSTNAQTPSPDFTSINKNYRTAQFYDMAANIDGFVMGGAQSNGTILINPDREADSTLEGEFVFDGTGGYCEMSQLKPGAFFAERQSGAIRRAANKNVPMSSFFDLNTDCYPANIIGGPCDPDGLLDGNPLFITPFVLWEDIIENLISGEIKSKFVTGNCLGEVWMTEEALDFTQTPNWRLIGQFQENHCVSAIAVSTGGTDIYVGTAGGRILHITNLDNENPTITETTLSETILSGTFQYITSIDVLHDPNHIIVGVSSYGSEANIVESTNAASENPTFTSLQHNLPPMPVYSVVRNQYNPNDLFAGTELGLWQYDFTTQTWTEENGIMGRVPIHSLKFQQMGDIGCDVLYAATHGRGMYRTTDFTFGNCDTEIAVGISDLENQISSLQLFPNPLQSQSQLELTLEETIDLTLRIYDLQGQLVRHQDLGEMAARKHQVLIERKDLKSGLYLVVLQSGKRQMSRKLLIK